MANSNDGPPIRLRSRRSRRNPNDGPRRYAGVPGRCSDSRRWRAARADAASRNLTRTPVGSLAPPAIFSQRVSVRVTYAKNKNQGQRTDDTLPATALRMEVIRPEQGLTPPRRT
jgi:hypothetical protein